MSISAKCKDLAGRLGGNYLLIDEATRLIHQDKYKAAFENLERAERILKDLQDLGELSYDERVKYSEPIAEALRAIERRHIAGSKAELWDALLASRGDAWDLLLEKLVECECKVTAVIGGFNRAEVSDG